MPLVDDWATKIANEVAPEEADQAPAVARAYLRGGYAKEALFSDPSTRQTTRSLFGPDTAMAGATMLPYIFDAIQQVGTELIQVLSSFGGAAGQVGADISAVSGEAATLSASPDLTDIASNTTGAAYYLVGAIGTLVTIRGRKERDQKKQELIGDERIRRVHDQIRGDLRKVPNLDEDKADLIAYRVLRTMLEEPSGAAKFTKEVEKTS